MAKHLEKVIIIYTTTLFKAKDLENHKFYKFVENVLGFQLDNEERFIARIRDPIIFDSNEYLCGNSASD